MRTLEIEGTIHGVFPGPEGVWLVNAQVRPSAIPYAYVIASGQIQTKHVGAFRVNGAVNIQRGEPAVFFEPWTPKGGSQWLTSDFDVVDHKDKAVSIRGPHPDYVTMPIRSSLPQQPDARGNIDPHWLLGVLAGVRHGIAVVHQLTRTHRVLTFPIEYWRSYVSSCGYTILAATWRLVDGQMDNNQEILIFDNPLME